MKIAWKVINGYGPYAYLQKTVHKGDTVVSEHVAYIGKAGVAIAPGETFAHEGAKTVAPKIGNDVVEKLNENSAEKLTKSWLQASAPLAAAAAEEHCGPTNGTVAKSRAPKSHRKGARKLPAGSSSTAYATVNELALVLDHPDVVAATQGRQLAVAESIVKRIKSKTPTAKQLVALAGASKVKEAPGPARIKAATKLWHAQQIQKAVSAAKKIQAARQKKPVVQQLADTLSAVAAKKAEPKPLPKITKNQKAELLESVAAGNVESVLSQLKSKVKSVAKKQALEAEAEAMLAVQQKHHGAGRLTLQDIHALDEAATQSGPALKIAAQKITDHAQQTLPKSKAALKTKAVRATVQDNAGVYGLVLDPIAGSISGDEAIGLAIKSGLFPRYLPVSIKNQAEHEPKGTAEGYHSIVDAELKNVSPFVFKKGGFSDEADARAVAHKAIDALVEQTQQAKKQNVTGMTPDALAGHLAEHGVGTSKLQELETMLAEVATAAKAGDAHNKWTTGVHDWALNTIKADGKHYQKAGLATTAMLTSAVEKVGEGILTSHLTSLAPDPSSAPSITPKVSMEIPKFPSGKPKVSKLNIKKLEAAAAKGPEELAAVGSEIEAKLIAVSKKAAIKQVVEDLMKQIGSDVETQESDHQSAQSEAIADVATGEQELPAQKVLSAKQAIQNEKEGTGRAPKNWDKDLKKLSGKKGSNEGGLYRDVKTQARHYIKWPAESHARMEYLANLLYRVADVPASDVRLIKFGGKTALMSDWLEDAKPMSAAEMKNHPDVQDNFVVDAWLANWDVVGMSADNIVLGPGGKAYRIDPGGSLLYRAKGALKPSFGEKVTELETMLQGGKNPQAANVFGDLSKVDMKKLATRVTDITDSQIDEAVDRAGIPNGKMAGIPSISNVNAHMKQVLRARRDHIVKDLLNWTPPTPMTAEGLAKVSSLPKETLKLIADESDKLRKPYGSKTAVRKKVIGSAMTAELGKKDGTKAGGLVSNHWGTWKGSAATDAGNFIRWAAGANGRSPKAAMAALERFWEFKVKKGQMNESSRKQLRSVLEKNIEADGPLMRSGMDVSNEANKALINTHVNHNTKTPTGKKRKLKTEVTIYQTWRPDQVEQMNLKPKVGETVEFNEPTVHSWSLSNGVFSGVSHGGMRTKATVPIDTIQITDRLNNLSGSYTNEDELIFCCPVTKMEVVKVA